MGMAKAFAATSVEKVRSRMKARPSNLSLPDRASTLKQTAELMLLQTILRDKTIGNKKFRKAANRVISLLVSDALEGLSMNPVQVGTANAKVNGVSTMRGIYG